MASRNAELHRQAMESYGPKGILEVIAGINCMLANWQFPAIVNLDETTDWAFQMSLARLRAHGENVTHQTSEYFAHYRPMQSVQRMLGNLGEDSERDAQLKFDGYFYEEHSLCAILEFFNLEVPPRGMTKSDFDLHLATGKDRLITHVRNHIYGPTPSKVRRKCLETLESLVDQIEPPQYLIPGPSGDSDRERPICLRSLHHRIMLAKEKGYDTSKLEMWWNSLENNECRALSIPWWSRGSIREGTEVASLEIRVPWGHDQP